MRNSLLKLLRLFVVAISLLSSIGAAAQSQRKITLKMENSSVETILNEIERQTDYLFVCESLDLTRKVSVNIVDKSLDEAMSAEEDAPTLGSTVADSEDEHRVFEKIALRFAIDKLSDLHRRLVILRYFRDRSGLRVF